MRLILILLIALVAFSVVQSYRHGCKFAPDSVWFDCVLGKAPMATTAPATDEAPPPAPQ